MSDPSSADEREILDNFISPFERRTNLKTPSRKRPAPGSYFVGSTSTPAAKRTPTSVRVKREQPDANMPASKNAPKIVFGLDFGTT